MKSSSIKMIDAGISNPREYRDSLIHDWELKPEYIEHLGMYILRETRPSTFFFHLKDGELTVKGRQYSIVWINSPKEIREAQHLLLSLRYCRFLERGYVLVKVLQGDGTFVELEY